MDHVTTCCYNGPDCPLCREATQQRKEDLDRLVEAVGEVLWRYHERVDIHNDPKFEQLMEEMENVYAQVS